MAKIRLVVLDWAGTVLDFGCLAPTGAFVQTFAEAGVPITLAEARQPMGLHKKDHIRELFRMPRIAAAWQVAKGQAWSEDDVLHLYQHVTPMQVKAAGVYSTLVPGVLECAKELRFRGIKIAGSTGYFHEAAEVCYTRAKEQGYQPDFTICADEVSAGRPAPWMIYRSMEAMNVYPPTAVVKVGDTCIDIEDGVNAGVWSVGVVDSSNLMGLSHAELVALSESDRDARRVATREMYFNSGADAVIDSISELPELITEFEKLL